MLNLVQKLAREERGQDLVEYALLAAGIGIALIPTIPSLATALIGAYDRITSQVETIGTSGAGEGGGS